MDWAAGDRNFVFYVNDGKIAGRDHEWVKDTLTVTVAMFRRMGLKTNLEKTKSVFFTPGFIWGEGGDQAYKVRVTGEGAMFRDSKRMRLSCTYCVVTLASSYLKHHMARLHDICIPQMRRFDEGGGGPTTYLVSFSMVLQLVIFPVPGCPEVAHIRV